MDRLHRVLVLIRRGRLLALHSRKWIRERREPLQLVHGVNQLTVHHALNQETMLLDLSAGGRYVVHQKMEPGRRMIPSRS